MKPILFAVLLFASLFTVTAIAQTNSDHITITNADGSVITVPPEVVDAIARHTGLSPMVIGSCATLLLMVLGRIVQGMKSGGSFGQAVSGIFLGTNTPKLSQENKNADSPPKA